MRSGNSLPVALTDPWPDPGFGLYIHWPFCQAKCPYCDFNSHVAKTIDHAQWRDAYLSELGRVARETPGRILQTVFFGGGTPSLMDPDVVSDILDAVHRLWPQANDVEITLEANPTSVEAGRFSAFRQAGINRVSMGIQALNDHDLKQLGRLHTAREAMDAFEVAKSCFDRVSFDLIYARQDQSLTEWKQELKQALTLAGEHISLYQLTIEDNTAFGDRFHLGKLRGLPTDDTAADMYSATQEICGEAGLQQYEVSNHAVPGAESRHNMIYWTCGDYIGIGPGAHGRLTLDGQRFATETVRNPSEWRARVAQGSGEKPRTRISRSEQALEYLLMGLRITDGIDARRYEQLSGHALDEGRLDHLVDLGFVSRRDHQISVTNQGFIVLNSILSTLVDA